MPDSYVLTTASTVTCQDDGPVALTSSAKLSVDGNPVLLEAGVLNQAVTCPVVLDTSNDIAPCTEVSTVTAGFAAKLQVDGQAVLLDSLQGTTNGTPPPLAVLVGTQPMAKATAGQTRLIAVPVSP